MKSISIRGKTFVGTVVSDKMNNTVLVQWERRVPIRKFERYEKRRSRVAAHNPESIDAKEGDVVRIKETKPLSKTKNFIVTEIVSKAE